MSYAILIPGKSNSSRLSGKNFMNFNGKPLIDYTIEFAKKFEYPIYVSTDVKDFKRDGCITIIRPSFVGKDVDMEIVVQHAIKKIKEDNIILLQVTTPIRAKTLIEKCIDAFVYHKKNIVTIDRYSLAPNGYCFIFPKHEYIWNHPLHLIMTERYCDIDYIWDFRIAEAIARGDYS